MSEDLNAENSDATEVAIDSEESTRRWDQLNELQKREEVATNVVLQVILVALPWLAVCVFVTVGLVDAVFQGVPIPIWTCLLMGLVSLVTSLGTVTAVRQWFSRTLHSPTGYVASRSIRFVGGMFLLLIMLLALGLALSPHFKALPDCDVEGWQWLSLASCVGLGLLMRFFPRGELK